MKKFFVLIFVLISVNNLYSQENKTRNPLGITIEYGIGPSAIVDNYISQERYTGTLPYIGIWYGRFHEKSAYQLGLSFQRDSDFKNHAITADFSRVSLNYDLFYSVREMNIFNKPATLYLGPSAEYFEYELYNTFASKYKTFSELIMVSMGMNCSLHYKLSDRFSTNFFLRTNILGATFKTHDDRKYNDENAKFQSLFSANNITGDILVKYKILKFLSAGVKFKGQLTKSTGWDESRTFTNSVLLSVTFHI
ncbi:MAG: hypothetical protein K8S16_19525 [Bacteroidales bacterium]|nr:hypothetical protein [Bacteroidales bacterium]